MAQIEYFTIDELGPDKPLFRCDPRRATMQVAACKSMWEQANTKGAPERLSLCRGCALGAVHAGVGEVTQSPLFASGICSRCHRTGMRLVGHTKCVSCWNREREYLLGRNAKGAVPRLHPRLFTVHALLRVGDKVVRVKVDRAIDATELVVAKLRDESKRVLFAFGQKPGVSWVQQELAL